MSQPERSDYVKFRGVTKSFMTICGLWHYETTSLFYRLIPYKQIVFIVTLIMAILKFIYENHSNLLFVVNCLNFVTGYMFTCFKVLSFILNKENLKNLQKALDLNFDDMLEDSKISKLILNKISIFKSISLVYAISVVLTTTFYMSIPAYMISYISYHKINVTQYPLLYPASYMWKRPAKGLFYQLNFSFEFATAVFINAVTVSIDTTFMLYVFQMIGQLRKISYYVTNTGKKSDQSHALSTYVSQYVNLIKYKDSFEKVYGPIILILLTTNAVVLCTILFQLTHVRGFSGKSIIQGLSYLLNLILKVTQTFLYSWSGSCLTEESEKCQYAVFSANWHGNKKMMSSIVIILSQRPLFLTACNFTTVNVRIFVMILQTSMSYFFLLQTLDENH
ncbi:odorant receptor 4-like [Cotesia glomerata]|uniref:odorant receptor 4-like n=1 Tax=Cotesia glomerata TaxID=32391 RepID=UPI001D01C144|nr:odorant receptor 4-like [Cotesia glomerata]